MILATKTWRRSVTALGVGAAILGASVLAADRAMATDWPERNVQIIVAYGAGGGTDRQSRITARFLEQTLGVPTAVQNMPGAGSLVATTAVYREDPDGYTILATNNPDLIMTVALRDAPYSLDEFAIVAVDVYDPRLLVVPNDSPIQTFDDFVQEARANPGALSISVAAGGAQDTFARWLVAALDLDVRIVGYPSGGAAATAVLGGHVTANMGDDFSRLDLREEVRGLLLGSPQASPRWPEAELLKDTFERYDVELPSPDFLARYHIYVVKQEFKDNHPERFQKLQDAFLAVRELPEYRTLIAEQGYEDLALMAPGDEFEAGFQRTNEVLQEMRDQLQ